MTGDEKKSIQEQVSCGSGMLAKYRSTMVGEGGNGSLCLYEVISFFFLPVPGKIGMLLRRWVLPLLLGKIGKSVRVGANCTIRNGKQIFLADNVVIGDKVTLDVKPGENSLILQENVLVGDRVILNCSGGKITLGEGTVVEGHGRLGSLQGLTVGRHCRIGKEICIVGAGHATDDLEKPIIKQAVTCNGPSFIGDFVSIGERVTLLNGIRIGSRVTIASDSLVLRDVPDGCTVAGVPARIINEKAAADQEH